MIIQIFNKRGELTLLDVEVESHYAWKQAIADVNEEISPYKLPQDRDKLYKILGDRAYLIEEALLAGVEYHEGITPKKAEITGWWDIYQGDLTKEEEKLISKAIKESVTLDDLLSNLSKYFDGVRLIFDEYGDDFTYCIEKLKTYLKGKEHS